MDRQLVGTWLLRSHQVEDRATGERSEPFGTAPSGVMIVLADGRMSVLITGEATATVPAPLIAYAGHCDVPSPGRFVTAVDVASIAPWVGTEQERGYTVAGDRLELSTASPQSGNDGAAEMRVATMVWVRETTPVATVATSD